MKTEALAPLRQTFDAFTQRCEDSRLPIAMKPSAILIGYDPLLSQGTFRMTGDPHALAQVMLRALNDPDFPAFREVLKELREALLKE